MKKFFTSIIFLLIAFFIVACGDNTDLQKIADEMTIGYQTGDTNLVVTKDITLPNNEIEGATITWKSNNAAIKVEGNKGIVTRGDANTNVTLTVTVTKGDKEATATFNVVVKAKDPVVVDESVTVVFTITLPAYTPTDDSIYIVGDFTEASGIPSWTPDANEGKMTRVNATTATFELKFEKLTESFTILYKYTRGSWENVEKDANKGELDNRTLTVTSEERTVNQADTVATWADLDAPLTEQQKLDAAKTALTITQTNVTADFELPLTGLHSTTVEWASNNDAIEIDGKDAIVTRGDEDVTVTLTATIKLGELTTTKTFSVVVKAEETPLPTDQDKVDEAKEELTIDEGEVTADFELPVEGLNDTTITWESDDDAIEIDGADAIVTRGAEDVTVTLTATISLNDATATKTFEVVVKAEEVVVDLEEIVESITITFADDDDKDNVINDLVLPNNDVQGVTITWTSDNDAIKVEGSAGVVTRGLLDVTVTLTVTATLDDESETATHVVVVKGIEAIDIADAYGLLNDAVVTIQGVITGISGTSTVSIQDETAAITIFSADAFEDLIALIGKEVKLTAIKGTNNSLHQLVNVEEFSEIGEAELPEALDLQTLDAWGSALAPHQSKIVKAELLKVTGVSYIGGANLSAVLLDEETNLTITLYMPADFLENLATDLATDLKAGYYVNVVALLSWFGSNPQIAVTQPGQVTIPTDLTVDQKAEMAVASAMVPSEGNVLEDFILGQPKYFDAVITWSVSEQDAIEIVEGVAVVTQQANDVPAILTYEVKIEDIVVATNEIEVNVLALGSVIEIAKYTGATANMTDGNQANKIALDPEIFIVTAIKGSASNNVGLNGGGTIRLYFHASGGSTLKIAVIDDYVITAFKINYGSTVAKSLIMSGETELYNDTPEGSGSLFFNGFEILEFSIQNVNPTNTQIWIESIEITYKPAAPKPEYEVDFDLGYPEAEVLTPVLVTEGKKVTRPEDPEREGFVFLGWFLNDEEFDFETPITENIILVAKWEDASQMMNVTFMDGVEEYLVIPVVSGAKVEKPEDPVKEGFVFVAWQLEGVDFDFDTAIEEDIILVAKWEEVEVPSEPTLLRESDFGETDGWGAYSIQSNKAIENGENDSEPNGTTTWDILGGNVNNKGWDFIRMGGKEASTEESPKVYLQTKFTFASQVTRIVIKIVALDSASGDETVYLQTSTNGTNWVTVANKTTLIGDLEFDELNIAQGTYFRFVFGRASTTNNVGTDVKTISFFSPQA